MTKTLATLEERLDRYFSNRLGEILSFTIYLPDEHSWDGSGSRFNGVNLWDTVCHYQNWSRGSEGVFTIPKNVDRPDAYAKALLRRGIYR